jgi:hypothetical protein
MKLVILHHLQIFLTYIPIDNKFWTSSECKSDIPFFPFSSTVYLQNKTILVMGGFNDEVEGQKTFSSRVLKINEKKVKFLANYFISNTNP